MLNHTKPAWFIGGAVGAADKVLEGLTQLHLGPLLQGNWQQLGHIFFKIIFWNKKKVPFFQVSVYVSVCVYVLDLYSSPYKT